MSQIDDTADMLYKNLCIALMHYEDGNGHSPGRIFMESAAFWLFKHFNSSVVFHNMPLADGTTFEGIPVKEVKENGCGIYLSDGPILLEAYEGTNSENVVYNCQGYISKTNADSIRCMNDEQLSEFLNSHMVCDCCVHEETCTDYSKPDQCRAGVLAWLQKPVQAKAGLVENAGGNQ